MLSSTSLPTSWKRNLKESQISLEPSFKKKSLLVALVFRTRGDFFAHSLKDSRTLRESKSTETRPSTKLYSITLILASYASRCQRMKASPVTLRNLRHTDPNSRRLSSTPQRLFDAVLSTRAFQKKSNSCMHKSQSFAIFRSLISIQPTLVTAI